jgi:DNA-directed RNA polymerase subunit RPC12/RpoP
MSAQFPPDEGGPSPEVELVSSGYAWHCPECSHAEYESAVPSSGMVRCTRCGATFRVSRVSHRVEGGALDNAYVVAKGEPPEAPRADD